MKNKSFVVFLDVDGVLNSRTTVQRTPDGYQGIDDARVEVLAGVIRKMGEADIVLTSDWKDMKPNDADYLYLVSKRKALGETSYYKWNRESNLCIKNTSSRNNFVFGIYIRILKGRIKDN